MSSKNANQTLVEEKLALDLFLQSLLTEPSLELEQPVETETRTETRTETVAEVRQPIEQPVEAPVIETPAPEAPLAEAEPEAVTETVAAQLGGEDLPPWADLFQAMLFKVAGLTLAVPLEELGGVVEFDEDNLTEMPGHAEFYLGIMQHLGKSIPVVDTARLVFPPDKLQQLVGDDPYSRVRRVVLINDGSWGLACDEVDEVITLRKDEVRWRSNRTRRRWLLGTVIDQMCALVDTRAFAEKLADGSD